MMALPPPGPLPKVLLLRDPFGPNASMFTLSTRGLFTQATQKKWSGGKGVQMRGERRRREKVQVVNNGDDAESGAKLRAYLS